MIVIACQLNEMVLKTGCAIGKYTSSNCSITVRMMASQIDPFEKI